jgi:hypothetical protein
MPTKFKVKRSTVSSVTPTTGDIDTGELAINLPDRKLFTSNGSAVYELGSNQTNLSVSANLTIGASGDLVFTPGAGIYANGSLGTAGFVLHSNATSVYWAAASGTGTVTSVATGNGLTGGPITTTGTISVLANNGIVANTTGVYVNANTGLVANVTGVYVNSTYIGTLSANNTTYLNGQLAAYYTNATNITTGTLPWAQAPTGTVNTSSTFTFSGIQTYNANVVIGSTGELVFNTAAGIYANGSLGTAGQVLTSNATTVYWSTPATGTVTSVATGNGLTGGTITGTGTISVVANSGIVANSTGTFVNANNGITANSTGVFVRANTGLVANATGVYVNSTYIGTLSANNTSFLGGTAAASYQLNSTLAANVATMAANSSTYANSSVTNTFTVGTAAYFVSNGNVGIGNTTPNAKLQVTGTANVSGNVFIGSNLGVGTSPSYKLDVIGSSGSGIVSRGWSANNTQSAGMHFMAINNGGTGDTNVAGYTFHCSGTYATHMHLRADGYIGMGGWSATAWRWYVNMGNGDMVAAGNVTAYSDPRLKEDIKKIDDPLGKVLALNGVRFRWKQTSVIGHPGEHDYGVLANEVEAVMPELVKGSVFEAPEGDTYKTVSYDKLVPVLIEAIKEQQVQIDKLKEELTSLKQG